VSDKQERTLLLKPDNPMADQNGRFLAETGKVALYHALHFYLLEILAIVMVIENN